MVSRRRGRLTIDILYLCGFAVGVFLSPPTNRLALLMGLFAVLVVLVDWNETRTLVENYAQTRRDWVSLGVLTAVTLAVWVALATRQATQLDQFFALLAGFFVLKAVRETVVVGLTPVELILQGYTSLVAIYLVLGATADAIDVGQIALVVIAVAVYVVRKLFRWVPAALDWLAGPQESASD